MENTDKTRKLVTTLYGLYLAIIAGDKPEDLEVDREELGVEKVDATIVLAKQAKQDHDTLTSEELDEELAVMFGGESRESLYDRIAGLEGSNEELRSQSAQLRHENAGYVDRVGTLNARLGTIIGLLTVGLRGRGAYDSLVARGQEGDAVSLADLAGQTIKANDEGLMKSVKAIEEMTKTALDVAKKLDEAPFILALAMGVPPTVARTLSIEVLAEALHDLCCYEHGSMTGPDSEQAEGDAGKARALAVKAAVLAAVDKVKTQDASETFAGKARSAMRPPMPFPFGAPFGGRRGMGGFPGGLGGLAEILGGLGRVRRGPGGQAPRSGDEQAMMGALDRLMERALSASQGQPGTQSFEEELPDGLGRIKVSAINLDDLSELGGEGGGRLSLGARGSKKGPFGDEE